MCFPFAILYRHLVLVAFGKSGFLINDKMANPNGVYHQYILCHLHKPLRYRFLRVNGKQFGDLATFFSEFFKKDLHLSNRHCIGKECFDRQNISLLHFLIFRCFIPKDRAL